MLSPIEVITTPVTSGGNKGIKRPISGANNVVIKPAAIVAPNIPSRPISGFIPMAIIGVTAANVTDIITGRRIPIKRPIPIHCNNVTIPQQKRSELMSIAIASFERPSRSPIIRGTATAPAYMTRTCCRPSMISFPGDNMRSTSSVGRSCPEDEGSWESMALISVSPFARQSKKQPFMFMKLSKHMLVECQFLRGRGVRDRNCGGNHIIVVKPRL